MSTKSKLPNWKVIHTIIFDFDGIFTNNKVWVNKDGTEFVCCDRGDGLGIDILKIFSKENSWKVKLMILSKESNAVVSTRAKKLGLDCYHDVSNKLNFIKKYVQKNFPDKVNANEGIVYLGNDLNDYLAISYVGYSVAPSDSHSIVKNIADIVLDREGGNGFVRLFVEELLKVELFEGDNINKIIKKL